MCVEIALLVLALSVRDENNKVTAGADGDSKLDVYPNRLRTFVQREVFIEVWLIHGEDGAKPLSAIY